MVTCVIAISGCSTRLPFAGELPSSKTTSTRRERNKEVLSNVICTHFVVGRNEEVDAGRTDPSE